MKKITKYILLAVGVCLIIFGSLMPVMFKSSNDELTYSRKSISGYYYCNVYIKTQEDYNITKAVITLKNAFDEHDTLTKTVDSLDDVNLLRKKDGKYYTYTISIHLTSSEYFNYTEVESATLTTNIGTRIAKEKDVFAFNWKIPVMIVMFLLGGGLTIGGIIMLVADRANKNSATNARKEMASSNPEINTTNMSDDEVLSKYDEIKSENKPSLAEFLGLNQPKPKICDYCGSTNDADAKKCSSCGASIRKKK